MCVVDVQPEATKKTNESFLKIALSGLVYIECGIDKFTHRAKIQPDNQLALNVVLQRFYGCNMTHIELLLGSSITICENGHTKRTSPEDIELT